jgi:hypothetical protein
VRDYVQAKVANDQNDVMKHLTVVASILLLPTFIVGLYGQNVKGSSVLGFRYGYAWSWALIVLTTIAQLLYFRRKKWIEPPRRARVGIGCRSGAATTARAALTASRTAMSSGIVPPPPTRHGRPGMMLERWSAAAGTCSVRPRRTSGGQSGKAMCTSRGEGAPAPVSTRDFRLIR